MRDNSPHGTVDEWLETTRRRILGGSAVATAGGVAGCSESSDISAARDTVEAQGTEHDHGGDHLGESTPVDRIDVANLSGNRRDGNVVYYDPNEPGPYSDLEEAVADVPTGGTLQLGPGTYRVGEEGRIAPGRAIHVRGSGWRYTLTDRSVEGTLLDNTQDPIDEPVIEFATDLHEEHEEHDWLTHMSLQMLAVEHRGDSPAVRFRNAIRSLVADCRIGGGGTAPTGIEYVNESFFARALRNSVLNFTDYGIQVKGFGYGHEFYSNHARAWNDEGTGVGIETHRQRTIIVGGQYTGNVAIRYYNPTQYAQTGGFIVEPGIENADVGVEIDSDGDKQRHGFRAVQCWGIKLSPIDGGGSGKEVGKGIRFGNTSRSKLVHPVTPGSWATPENTNDLAEWSSDAKNCGVILDAPGLEGMTYTNHGATNPYVKVVGTATDAQLASFDTGVPTAVDYAIDQNAPAYHDGEEWYAPTSAMEQIALGQDE
jgi:hypothetical protein